eukprot:6371142-Amphidinium_carterae.1
MMTACKANHNHTLRLLIEVGNAAKKGEDCAEMPKRFTRLSLRLASAIDKIVKKTELGVKIAVSAAVMRKKEQQKGKTLTGHRG